MPHDDIHATCLFAWYVTRASTGDRVSAAVRELDALARSLQLGSVKVRLHSSRFVYFWVTERSKA